MVSRQRSPFHSFVRPAVQSFEPYLPGRSMESVRAELGLAHVIKLASNENALGPSPRAQKAVIDAAKNFFLYPDGASTLLRQAISKKFEVDVREVIIGAGSDELIELLAKTFLNSDDAIVVSEHAFVRYQLAAELMGAQVIRVPMKDYRHDLAAMMDAVTPACKMVFLANPNNPTGTYNSQTELEELLRRTEILNRHRRRPLAVVVDEAYFEYASTLAGDYPQSLALRKRYSHLIVLRTFSKAHALAGLRVGYGFADPELIEAMDRVRPPFNVSVAGQVAAEASLGDAAHNERSISLVRAGQKQLVPAMERLGLTVVPSIGNFFLLNLGEREGSRIFDSLLHLGIIVRSMGEYGFPHHIRVTYGLPADNKSFLEALTEVLSQ